MGDVQFECPSCATSLVVADDVLGELVTCPHCGNQVEVPGRMRVSAQRESSPPIRPGYKQDYRDFDVGFSVRTRNCTIAYVSLVLVCLSLITGGLLLIPGIICGHIAVGQCNRDPNMTGKSFAMAALTVAYVIVGFCLLILFWDHESTFKKIYRAFHVIISWLSRLYVGTAPSLKLHLRRNLNPS